MTLAKAFEGRKKLLWMVSIPSNLTLPYGLLLLYYSVMASKSNSRLEMTRKGSPLPIR
jgi:hypothetical protein